MKKWFPFSRLGYISLLFVQIFLVCCVVLCCVILADGGRGGEAGAKRVLLIRSAVLCCCCCCCCEDLGICKCSRIANGIEGGEWRGVKG